MYEFYTKSKLFQKQQQKLRRSLAKHSFVENNFKRHKIFWKIVF